MIVSLEEMKQYLKVDHDDDDAVIQGMMGAAEKLCMDILRAKSMRSYKKDDHVRIGVMYATAYLYEHREEADHHSLTLTLRSLLFGSRQEVF